MVGVTRTARQWLLVLMTSFTVMACGGGGGGGSTPTPTPAPDTTPTAFAPGTEIIGVVVNENATFDAFTVEDIDVDVSISIENGFYAINDGEFTDQNGTVSVDDTVSVRVTASESFETESTAIVSIGTVTGNFTVISELPDFEPEPFDLGADATANTSNTFVESEVITIAGINAPAEIVVQGGELRIGDSGDFTSEVGFVENGQQVQVRVLSSENVGESVTATLFVDTLSDRFAVTTVDDTPPVAQIVFPTPATMTDGTSITLRGSSEDDFGPVASIRVTVTTDDGATSVDTEIINATDADDFSDTWSINVDLGAEKINTIAVEAIDAAGNVQAEPTIITMLQAADALNTNFPEANDVHIGSFGARGAVLDKDNSRMLVLDNGDIPGDILAVDLLTGLRTLFLDNISDMQSAAAMHLLPNSNEIVVSDQNGAAIYRSPLENPTLTLLTDSTFEDTSVPIMFPKGLRFDQSSGKVFSTDSAGLVFSIDPSDGTKALIADNSTDDSSPLFINPNDLVINEIDRTLLVTDLDLNDRDAVGTIFTVNIDDGSRSVVSVQDGADFGRPFGIDWLVHDEVAIVSSRSPAGLSEPGMILKLDLNEESLITIAANDIPVGAANDVQVPQYLSVDSDMQVAYIVTGAGAFDSRSSILILDATSGERVVLTRSVP